MKPTASATPSAGQAAARQHSAQRCRCAARLAPEGVTVNAIAPGLIETDMGQSLINAGVAARIPVKRAGTGAEIAQAVLLLASNGYMTGQTLAVNGGSLFS